MVPHSVFKNSLGMAYIPSKAQQQSIFLGSNIRMKVLGSEAREPIFRCQLYHLSSLYNSN